MPKFLQNIAPDKNAYDISSKRQIPRGPAESDDRDEPAEDEMPVIVLDDTKDISDEQVENFLVKSNLKKVENKEEDDVDEDEDDDQGKMVYRKPEKVVSKRKSKYSLYHHRQCG